MNNQRTKIIRQAIKYLQAGKLVALPTETVYGLAADATNLNAVKKIFTIKNRPLDHSLPLLIAQNSDLNNWAIDVPEIAKKLARRFWPGPLTMILKRAPHIADIITGGLDTIGLRCPDHPITQKILANFPHGLAAPSANLFGAPPPTNAKDVKKTLGDKIDLIVDGGECLLKTSSTIIDLTNSKPKILRAGPITSEKINHLLTSINKKK